MVLRSTLLHFGSSASPPRPSQGTVWPLSKARGRAVHTRRGWTIARLPATRLVHSQPRLGSVHRDAYLRLCRRFPLVASCPSRRRAFPSTRS
jgi:hypothetical protein